MVEAPPTLTTGEIASALKARLVGDADARVSCISPIDVAKVGSITFLSDRKYLATLAETTASAVIIKPEFEASTDIPRLLLDDPYLGYARVSGLFASLRPGTGRVHSSASVDESAEVAADVDVGAGAVIGAGCRIGAGCVIGAAAVIGEHVQLGDRVRLHPNATILDRCIIGDDCEIHSGAVLGADGFGWARGPQGWEKIHQLGRVVLGNRVSVGANTCIDRGALGDTEIADGVILDNLIQIAHNVSIGENTAIAGCVGIAGSTRIGSNCTIAGAVGIVGHITICDRTHVTAKSFVNRSILEPGSYSSAYPIESTRSWRKNAVRLHKLDKLARSVSRLEKK